MKVVFILKAIEHQRCLKRITAFLDQGYDVHVYGFNRRCGAQQDYNFELRSLGEISNNASYLNRIMQYLKAKKIVRKYKDSHDTLFYLFGLDLALPLITIAKAKPYIYEESDLIHTKFKSRLFIRLFEFIDKWVIKKSKISVFTSEGFSEYHFPNEVKPSNICILPNKVNTKCLELNTISKKFDVNNLTVGFVGTFRYESIFNFLYVTATEFPHIQIKLFGKNVGWTEEKLLSLLQFPNVSNEGPFKNPQDLPQVYSKIDLVLSTYDIECDNPRYAEPNKVYEAMFFETPIIVSTDTYLANKVERLNIGYHLNAMSKTEILSFWNHFDVEDYNEKVASCRKIKKTDCVDNEKELFEKIEIITKQ